MATGTIKRTELTTSNIRIAFSDGATQTITLTPPTGYKKCLGIVGLTSEGALDAVSNLYEYHIVGGGEQITVKWQSGTSSNAAVSFSLLWK